MSNKRFRDTNGNLTMPSEEIAEATWEEAKSYYQADCRYRYREENFVLLVLEEVGVVMTPRWLFSRVNGMVTFSISPQRTWGLSSLT